MKILAIILIIIFIFQYNYSLVHGTADDPNLPKGYEEIAESDNTVLLMDKETKMIAVMDKRNGYVWKSAVDNTFYDIESINAIWRKYVTSLFIINYFSFEKNDGTMQKVPSCQAKCTIGQSVGNKIRLDYNYEQLGISLILEIGLSNDTLTVRIPADGIRETGGNGLVNVELMPFFGAADHKVDGYIMYPDGCGALLNYKDINSKPKDKKMYTWSVYGPANISRDEYEKMDDYGIYQAMFPVFGVKNGKNAFLAIASEGEADAEINLSPEGYVLNLNRINFKFTYRNSFDIITSNISASGNIGSKSGKGIKIDKNMIRNDHEVKYMFLYGNEANYSGMANIYREYLLDEGRLKKAIDDNDRIPLAVDFFMGIKEKRLLFDKFITMTTFSQAEEITGELLRKGVAELQIMLKGWVSGGYGRYPVNWPAERKLGGNSGLNKFADYAKNNNIKLFVQTNFINALNENGGFSAKNDAVRSGNGLIVTDEKNNWFLLSVKKVLELVKSFLNKFSKTTGGIAVEKMGEIVYSDYNAKSPSSRVNTQKTWENILEYMTEEARTIAVEGANAYVLAYADRLFDIPDETSGYYITDETIPFIQMVLHGTIPYTFEPGNLSSNFTREKLKWVEYGYMPFFELTYENSQKLKYTSYNRLFSSTYTDWLYVASDVYKEFNERLQPVWSEKMIEHKKIDEDLYRIKYGNGTAVYVNYMDKDRTADGFTIRAEDYLVVDKEGNVK